MRILLAVTTGTIAAASIAAATPAIADTPDNSSPTPPGISPTAAPDPWTAAQHRQGRWTTTDLTVPVADGAPDAAAGAALGAALGPARPAVRVKPTHPQVRRAFRHQQRVKPTPTTRQAHARTTPSAEQNRHVEVTRWRVGPGDTLTGIAAVNGTSVRWLVAVNADRYPSLRTNPDLIRVGWVLRVPKATR